MALRLWSLSHSQSPPNEPPLNAPKHGMRWRPMRSYSQSVSLTLRTHLRFCECSRIAEEARPPMMRDFLRGDTTPSSRPQK